MRRLESAQRTSPSMLGFELPIYNARPVSANNANAPLKARLILRRWLPVIVWMAVIFFFSSRPDLPLPSDDFLSQIISTLGHVTVYGVLMALLLRAISGGWRHLKARHIVIAYVVLMAYALSDEFHQAFVPHRTPDPLDLLADFAGATIALVLWKLVARRWLPDAG